MKIYEQSKWQDRGINFHFIGHEFLVKTFFLTFYLKSSYSYFVKENVDIVQTIEETLSHHLTV